MEGARHMVVGFDLDMTLIDSRHSVRTALEALAAETGAPIDVDYVVAHLGLPLEMELSPWFDESVIATVCDRYRAIHGELLHLTRPMPGAFDAVAAVRRHRGQVLVVTSKFEPHARASLAAIDIVPDAVVGWRFGAAKGPALREYGGWAYVGDHLGDVAAAKAAGVQ